MRTSSGIYVEIEIQADLDHVWLLNQDPAFGICASVTFTTYLNTYATFQRRAAPLSYLV